MFEVTLNHYCGDDLTTCRAARVSFDKQTDWEDYVPTKDGNDFIPVLSKKDKKLINYLGEYNHISPFGHSFLSFTVTAPVFVARQLVKHSFLRWNEVSRRYVDDPPELYTPDVWRGRAADKKQGSSEKEITHLGLLGFKQPTAHERYAKYCEYALDLYDDMIDSGVAPEQARMVLPKSMMTTWWWSGSLDAFARMCNLRCTPDTQAETKIVADRINTIIQELFPVSWEALRNG